MYVNSITKALSSKVYCSPAIMMHLVIMAEQFDKLKNDNAFEILMCYDKDDLKGDYDGVNIAIIETIIREILHITTR